MMGVSVREGDLYCNGAKEASGRTLDTQKPRNARLFVWWAHTDLNRGPKDYESSALTN